MAFVSGPYSWRYKGSPLGVMEDAPRLRFSFTAEEIRGDNLGDAIQSLINRGGSVYLDLVLQEWNQNAVQDLIWPFSSTIGRIGTALSIPESGYRGIGCTMGGAELTATADANSCVAASGGFANWTFHNVVIAPGFDVSWLMGSRLRNVPLSLLCLPSVVPGVVGTDPGAGALRYFTAA